MNDNELREFRATRRPSPQAKRLDLAHLTCYGCAHSAAREPPPSMPSGERPCCSCIRNPDRERWLEKTAEKHGPRGETPIVIGDDGHARCFDPYDGALYNGAPTVYFPMDNYVTLDHADQERWLNEHPEYAKPVQFINGELKVVDRG